MNKNSTTPTGMYPIRENKDQVDDCDNCLYDNKNTLKNVDDCAGCVYTPSKETDKKDNK